MRKWKKSDRIYACVVWALCLFVGCDSDKSPKKLPRKLSISNEITIAAGSRIIKDSYPEKDSPLAAQLRAAGAVILGKATMLWKV